MTKEEITKAVDNLKKIRKQFNKYEFTHSIDLAIDALEGQEQPTGKWIECTKSGMPLTEYGRIMGEKWYGFKCSRCNYIYKGNALVESPYCQECGARMEA